MISIPTYDGLGFALHCTTKGAPTGLCMILHNGCTSPGENGPHQNGSVDNLSCHMHQYGALSPILRLPGSSRGTFTSLGMAKIPCKFSNLRATHSFNVFTGLFCQDFLAGRGSFTRLSKDTSWQVKHSGCSLNLLEFCSWHGVCSIARSSTLQRPGDVGQTMQRGGQGRS